MSRRDPTLNLKINKEPTKRKLKTQIVKHGWLLIDKEIGDLKAYEQIASSQKDSQSKKLMTKEKACITRDTNYL